MSTILSSFYMQHYSLQTLSEEAKGAGHLLYKLIESFKVTGDLQRTLDSIEDSTVRVLSLPAEAHEQLTAAKSR